MLPKSYNSDQNLEVDKDSWKISTKDTFKDSTKAISTPRQKSERVKFACKRCRKKRRKCNGLQPCGNCFKSKSECAYEIENKRKPINKKYVDSLIEKIEMLKSIIGSKALALNEVNCESNVATLLKSSDPSANTNINYHDAFKLDMGENRLITFHGPTSYRHMSSPPLIVKPGRVGILNANTPFHREIFDWFFQNTNKDLPLVDQNLFESSITNSATNSVSFASNSLIHAIMAITLSRMNDPRYVDYKELAAKQVMEEINSINITQVQCLILLSLLGMTDNTEIKSSTYMSMAVALSNHLGLHLDCTDIRISQAEKELRQKVFWCCFIIDESRSLILGIDPLLESEDISTKLVIGSSSDYLLILREFCILLDIQKKAIKSIYSLKLQIKLKEKNRARQELMFIDTKVHLSKWVKDLPSICRSKNDTPNHPNMRMVLLMELCYHILHMLISKPITRSPYDPKLMHNSAFQTYDLSCKIMALIDRIDYNNCALLHTILYALYISTVTFFFHYHSPNKNVRKTSYINCKRGISLVKSMAESIPAAKVYYERIKIVKSDWKVNIDFEENQELNELNIPITSDIDFSNFIWPGIDEDISNDPTSLMASINFYEVFGS